MGYKLPCPACGGKNFYHTPENGISYCFNCGHLTKPEGEIAPLQRSPDIALYRQMYKELAAYYHSNLTTAHVQWLHARGISDTSIQSLQIGYCPDSSHILYHHELAHQAGIAYKDKAVPVLGNRIVFPYLHGNDVYDMRGRVITHDDATKYKSLLHSSYIRGADIPYNNDVRGKQIIITEGEIKAIVPTQFAMPTHALPGILSSRKIVVQPDVEYVICFDNQTQHRLELFQAIQKLQKRLNNRAKIATLPLFGREKQDIDGFILQHGIDWFRRIIAGALPYTTWQMHAKGY